MVEEAPHLCRLPSMVVHPNCFEVTARFDLSNAEALPRHLCLPLSAEIPEAPFRLIHCRELVMHSVLLILGTNNYALDSPDFQTLYPYSAVSHMWRALQTDGRNVTITTQNMDVLKSVCLASLKQGVEYLWFDVFCTLYREWTVANAHHIFRNANACFVLPSGIEKLVQISDYPDYPYLFRSWPLLEILCSRIETTFVLHAWDASLGDGIWEFSSTDCEKSEENDRDEEEQKKRRR